MTTKTTALELTQDQVITTLESVTHEFLRFSRFIDRQRAWGTSPSPETSARLDTLDDLVSILEAQAGESKSYDNPGGNEHDIHA